MNKGWIKLHRKLCDNAIMQKPKILAVFVYLLLNACHEEQKFLWNGEEITICPGQLITGRKKMSDQLNLSESCIRNAIFTLKATNTIAIKTTNKFSLVSILNWHKYQDETTNKTTSEIANRATNKRPTKGQQNDHIQEEKNVENSITKVIQDKDTSSKKDFGNQRVNIVLDEFTKRWRSPIDRKPRQVAQIIRQKIEKFIAEAGQPGTDENFRKVVIWLCDRVDSDCGDYSSRIQSLSAIQRRLARYLVINKEGLDELSK